MSAEQQPSLDQPVPRTMGGYTLGRRLGEGGMGVVYHGTDRQGRQVAIKVLRPHIAHDPDSRRRLEREVSTLSRVHSPRVAAVLDADVDGPAPYIVTEYIPGVALDTIVAEHGPLSGQVLVRLGRGLLEALDAIHEVGIVHRDLKPGNVLMVGRDPVVIDFGIAQVADDSRLTMTGMVMGTPGYLSPEVVEGGAVTRATDQWGWAATLAFAASGEPPFGRGPMPVVLDRVIRGRHRLEGVDPRMRPLLEAALAADPSRRPSSAEVMQALELYSDNRPVTQALETRHHTPAQPWPVAGAPAATGPLDPAPGGATSPPTQLHGPVDRTRVQPVVATPQTRQQPVMPSPWSGPQQGWVTSGPASAQQSPPQSPQQQVGRPAQPSPYAPPPAGTAYPSGGQGAGRMGGPLGGQVAGPLATPLTGPAPGGDPRIGKAARSGTLAAALALFVGLGAVLPMVAWGLFAIWSVATRTTDHAVTAMVIRRHEMGRRRSDVPMAVATSPWHLLLSALGTGLALLLPLAFAIAAVVISAGVLTQTGVLRADVDHPVPLAIGTLLGALIAWWGPGGVSLRRGSRTAVRALAPGPLSTQVAVVALVAIGAGLLVWGVWTGAAASWWPWTGDAPFSGLIPQVLLP